MTRRTEPTRRLAVLTSREQLRAGRMPRRLMQLFIGLTLYGVSMAMFVRAHLGLDPWDVFHYGIAEHIGVGLGTAVILVSIPVLLLWIPLRQWPGLGTIANAFWIGIATNIALWLMPTPSHLLIRIPLMVGAVLLNGIAGALYIGSQLGPGPRDGLMTGLHHRTGISLRVVRTSLELTVFVVGWLMGGIVGVGTVLYAVCIGPLVQHFLPLFIVDLPNAPQIEPKPAGDLSESCADAPSPRCA
ncbi:YczE/YyaS/YitT family protein [Leekyejoonella antrihumi]|uniref:YitT family protein n=1 Tax=Leekyejoonella antrihumi TaxID=1660198 RepID=A0A563DUH6_9MICO|nr:hypothetical protein [Leekyejoonella antrihumi]TWP33583.1 hypothetical protein FGL98_20825 [Leekyejoonella antrihumi]